MTDPSAPRPDAAPGDPHQQPRPRAGRVPIDKTGAPGVPADLAAPGVEPSAAPLDERRAAERAVQAETRRQNALADDVATDADWRTRGGTRPPADDTGPAADPATGAEHARNSGSAPSTGAVPSERAADEKPK